MTAAAVVDGYRLRARFCRAETVDVRRPRLLRGLLATTRHVAEIPCGTGHFLTDYARTDATVTLLDACPDMLEHAVANARDTGIPAARTVARLCTVQELPALGAPDLVVLPNAALNQLACQAPPDILLVGLRSAMAPGGELLAQVTCTHPGDRTDIATFYDPHHQHGVWFADRFLHPGRAAGAVLRRRRQHREGTRLRIEFDYRDPAGQRLHATTVELALFSASALAEAFTAAGFTHVRYLPGHGGLSEVLATAPPEGS